MKNYNDDIYKELDLEDELLCVWGICEYDSDDDKYKNCDDCEKREECLETAEDNKCGYELFEDIVSDAYGSVDAFWECNGI